MDFRILATACGLLNPLRCVGAVPTAGCPRLGRVTAGRRAALLLSVPSGFARLPGFHTTVGGGGTRQEAAWYQEKGAREGGRS